MPGLITNMLGSRREKGGYRMAHSTPAVFLKRDIMDVVWLDNSSSYRNVSCIVGYFVSLVFAHQMPLVPFLFVTPRIECSQTFPNVLMRVYYSFYSKNHCRPCCLLT